MLKPSEASDSGLNLLSVLSYEQTRHMLSVLKPIFGHSRMRTEVCSSCCQDFFMLGMDIGGWCDIWGKREWHMHLEGLNGSPNQITTCHPPAVLARSQIAASRWRGIAQLAFAAWCLHSTCTPLGSVQCPLITCRVSEDTTWHYYMNCTFF